MIDLHSHLLPAVDDGVRTLERAVQVLEQMAGRGVTDVCLTPHLEASRAEQGIPASHDDAYVRLVGAAPAQVRLHRGVELMLDRPFPPAAAADRRLTLGGSRYILVEFMPMVSPLAATNALAHVTNLGMVPVLAHPERYACTTPGIVAQWKAGGAVMQVDANTLFARRRRGERARALVAAGLADILAADNHGDSRTVSEPYLHLCELGGGEQADLLLRRNPGGILADAATLEAVPPLQFKTSLLDRLRKLLDQEE